MMTKEELKARVAALEDDIRQRDETLAKVRADLVESADLVDRMRENIEDKDAMIDQWVDAFDMVEDETGSLGFSTLPGSVGDAYSALLKEHNELVRDWNRLVARFRRHAGPRDPGRPLEASDAQVKEVRRLRKAGGSLRAIATATSLGLRTVRTIVEKDQGSDRTSQRISLLRRREVDRLRAAAWRDKKRTLDTLPKRITATRSQGAELVKAAKGFGSD